MKYETQRTARRPAAGVSRRKFLTWTGIATGTALAGGLWQPATAVLGQPAVTPSTVWNHDPASPIGPSHWAELGYPTCSSGLNQSPVNIDTGAVARQSGVPLVLTYETYELELENTGHYAEVLMPSESTSTLQVGNDRYPLVQYHFHAPAEHSINGRLADLEAHFVHTTAAGANAVVGLLFDIGDNPNPLLDEIFGSTPTTAGDTVTLGDSNPLALFTALSGAPRVPVQIPSSGVAGPQRVNVESFYFYDGSLTTPGCAEAVRWFLLTGSGQVSGSALDNFHQLISTLPNYAGYGNNNRPVLPLNGRVIGQRVAS
ncbi:MAG: carbonic anhydrase family protein [Chloroflexi bacterium]|nr:carbonic anhydrase family protein [Chloroflexota bacterium]MBV9597802.1 carbonic anhydrase family protein [Chloroflexota bacterium]